VTLFGWEGNRMPGGKALLTDYGWVDGLVTCELTACTSASAVANAQK